MKKIAYNELDDMKVFIGETLTPIYDGCTTSQLKMKGERRLRDVEVNDVVMYFIKDENQYMHFYATATDEDYHMNYGKNSQNIIWRKYNGENDKPEIMKENIETEKKNTVLDYLTRLGINIDEIPLRFVGRINYKIDGRNKENNLFESYKRLEIRLFPSKMSLKKNDGTIMKISDFDNASLNITYQPEIGDMVYDNNDVCFCPSSNYPIDMLWVAVAKTANKVQWIKYFNLFPDEESSQKAQSRMTYKDTWEVNMFDGSVLTCHYDRYKNYFPEITNKNSILVDKRSKLVYLGETTDVLTDGEIADKITINGTQMYVEFGNMVKDKNGKILVSIMKDDTLIWNSIFQSVTTGTSMDYLAMLNIDNNSIN